VKGEKNAVRRVHIHCMIIHVVNRQRKQQHTSVLVDIFVILLFKLPLEVDIFVILLFKLRLEPGKLLQQDRSVRARLSYGKEFAKGTRS